MLNIVNDYVLHITHILNRNNTKKTRDFKVNKTKNDTNIFTKIPVIKLNSLLMCAWL